MDDMPQPRHARLTSARALVRENPLLLGIAGIGFAVSFQTVAGLARAQHMPGWPVLYPLLIDLGILGFIVEARKALADGRSDLIPAAAGVAVLRGFTVYVNAHGSPARDWLGITLHVAAPVAVDDVPGADPVAASCAAGALERGDPIPRARWVLAPWPTWKMYRRMVLCDVPSYSRAVDMEISRRHAIARLSAHYRGKDWQQAAPGDLVWMLSSGVRLEEAIAQVAHLLAPPPVPVAPASSAPRKRGSAPRKPARRSRAQADPRLADLDTESGALTVLAAEPGISGSELGRRLGVSPAYGRSLKARLAGARPRGLSRGSPRMTTRTAR